VLRIRQRNQRAALNLRSRGGARLRVLRRAARSRFHLSSVALRRLRRSQRHPEALQRRIARAGTDTTRPARMQKKLC
jgi:hypothetical protein